MKKTIDLKNLQLLTLYNPRDWGKWLKVNHSNSEGIWLKFFKKDAGIPALTYEEALMEALCYGWIDGLSNSYDEKSWIRKFTPRRSKSVWSKRNTERINRLISEGRMKPAGMKQVEAAKADGRWVKGYDPPKDMTMPKDFLKELSKNKKAKTFFETLNKANTYAIGWRLQTAKKPETRIKRMKEILVMLKEGKKFH
ncbi:MAG TPA: YdeI/OmpD-associated family protein [Cyclobacteriaceae bacterium]|nr:YdeI/OmpD-associated family protein [Cyclobacteriaceae bacterium]